MLQRPVVSNESRAAPMDDVAADSLPNDKRELLNLIVEDVIAPNEPTATGNRPDTIVRRWSQPVKKKFSAIDSKLIEPFLFPGCETNPELARRARLVAWFGFLGFVFGILYAGFYLAIRHFWGAGIIVVCSLGFFGTPFVMRATSSIFFGGNFLAATMALGFTALCCVEGGVNGHAIAWLASVPLCALLLMGKRSAGRWVILSFAAAAAVMAAGLKGVAFPITYDLAWRPLVDTAGYLGLIAFLFALGLIFEVGREQAFGKMTAALRELAQSNLQLAALNKEKTEFLGIAAHDLRNPLTLIVSYADLLRGENGGCDVSKFAQIIYDAGSRMNHLIRTLLDAQAVEEGRFSCALQRCDVARMIADSVAQNHLNAVRKNSEIETAIENGLNAFVDPSTSVQVLDNLISNALKYSPPQSRIVVRAQRTGEQIAISVTDQGPGISAGDQARLFRRFTRLSARPTAGESSTGLGLSIAKRLVEAMKGSIECQSEVGHGATFTVRFPLCQQTA